MAYPHFCLILSNVVPGFTLGIIAVLPRGFLQLGRTFFEWQNFTLNL